MAEDVPFATRAELAAWLDEHGIAHAGRFSLEAVAPLVDPSLWSALNALGGRRRMVDMVSQEQLVRVRDWLPNARLVEALPALVWRFLQDERDAAVLARGERESRIAPPADPRRHGLHARLVELRARVPESVAARPARVLAADVDALVFDASLPGFKLREPRPVELLRAAGGFVSPEAALVLAPGACKASCTCGAPAAACVHALAAIDAVLLWLKTAEGDARFERRLAELERPAWQRTLSELDRAMTGGGAAAIVAGPELSWRVRVVDDSVDVSAWIARGKRGTSAARIDRRRLLLEHGARLQPGDARIASLLPDADMGASRALIEALVGHPRLVLADDPTRPVRVERLPVGLVAEERHGTVRLCPGIEGSALPPPLAERVRNGRADEPVFLWDADGDARRLTLLDVKPELRALLAVLHARGEVFPPESHAELLASLSRWAERVPVAMPRSVLGEQVVCERTPVLRLEVESDGQVRVELRVRPLPDAPALWPGDGGRDVHVRRGERALHARRDLRAETAEAEALVGELFLATAETLHRPFQWLVPPARALDVLATAALCTPAPALEWIGPPVRSAGTRGAGALRVVLDRRREWWGALGGLSVDGERVELARLLDAARRHERWVEVTPTTYVELDEVLRAALARVADHAHASAAGRGLAVSAAAASAIYELERAGARIDADHTWRELAARAEDARALTPRVPPELRAELRSYQREGFAWASRLAAWGAGGVLADDMGLGKTLQALAVLLDRRALGPALVLAPTSVAFNWCDEAARFAPDLRLHVFAEVAPDARAALLESLGAGDVLVVSYGLLVREIARLGTRRFATLVCDEAQGLKNASAQRVRAARALSADFKLALSGTPFENHLGELWSLYAVVFPGLLGSWESFRVRFATPIEKKLDPEAAPTLSRMLAPFLLRRTKGQVESELPPRTEVRVPVVLSGPEWQLYEDARLAALSYLEKRRPRGGEPAPERFDVLAALTRLRLAASHPRLSDAHSTLASAKLARLLELVDELRAEGQRALVFSQFTSHLALVREALDARGVPYVYLDGQTPQKLRGERVHEFQEGQAPLFLISLKAGGFGLNLTAASNVIHLDPWWNPAVEDQASDRAHRLGQERPVTIYRMISLGTIEEQMLALHASKRALVAQVLNDGEAGAAAGAGAIPTDELLALLAERPHFGAE